MSSAVLHQMIRQGFKSVHKLNISDLNHKDKMKFDPSLKLMCEDLIQHLKLTVSGSMGTAMYLTMMQNIYNAYTSPDMPMVDRIDSIW